MSKGAHVQSLPGINGTSQNGSVSPSRLWTALAGKSFAPGGGGLHPFPFFPLRKETATCPLSSLHGQVAELGQQLQQEKAQASVHRPQMREIERQKKRPAIEQSSRSGG